MHRSVTRNRIKQGQLIIVLTVLRSLQAKRRRKLVVDFCSMSNTLEKGLCQALQYLIAGRDDRLIFGPRM